jgi:hypothetical protein
VTGACASIRCVVFFEVGGLDEVNLPVSFNEVDLCLRVGHRGYRVVWTPFAELFHLESASRGLVRKICKDLDIPPLQLSGNGSASRAGGRKAHAAANESVGERTRGHPSARDSSVLGRHPRPSEIFLLVEVADTSLNYDLGPKLEAYARAGNPKTATER